MTLCKLETELAVVLIAICRRHREIAEANSPQRAAILRARLDTLVDRAAGLREGIRCKRQQLGLPLTMNGSVQLTEAI